MNKRDLSGVFQDQNYELTSVTMNYIFESLYSQMPLFDEVTDKEGGEVKNMQQQWTGSIKMMDTILFQNGFEPKKWIFTDLLGRIQFKEINSITINDVIRAFLVNLNENKKNEFNNEDLMEFLANSSNRTKICFAIVGNQRHFLDIESLSDIKNQFSKVGIDALQLYKIPTRDFLPFFYYHTLQFKSNGALQSHMITRVSHYIKDLNNKSQRSMEFYEEKIPDNEYNFFAFTMLDISKQLIQRIQLREQQSVVKSIKITYLIESTNYDPWFIGTEYCYLYMKKEEIKVALSAALVSKDPSKSLINFHKQSSRVNNKQSSDKKPQTSSFVNRLKDDVNLSRIGVQTSPRKQEMTTQQEEDEEVVAIQTASEDIFELGNKELVTQSELFQGLKQIGEKFGRDQKSNGIIAKRPRTMEVLTQQKTKKMQDYQQKLFEERTRLKEKGRRIVQLFPKYLEKSGSKRHAQFLFGNASSERVFKDYQRMRFQNQQHQENQTYTDGLGNKTSQSFYSKSNPYNKTTTQSIFDMQTAAAPEPIPNDKSLLTDLTYLENQWKHSQNNILNEDLTELNDNLILNKDISMFQQQNQSMYHQTADNISFKESVLSIKDDEHSSTSKSKIRNDYVEKSFIDEQSVKNSQTQKQDKSIFANDDIEKNIIKYFMLNNELENVVVLDKSKALNRIRDKLKQEEFVNQQQQQCSPYNNLEQDQIFNG